jgi:hypothetical protein
VAQPGNRRGDREENGGYHPERSDRVAIVIPSEATASAIYDNDSNDLPRVRVFRIARR